MMGADSAWGPALVALGGSCLLGATWIYGYGGKPTILRADETETARWPNVWERLSMHLVVYAVWAVAFGAVVWWGVPRGAKDVRLLGEANWPVIQNAEWVYLSSYLVPLTLPWLRVRRAALRRYAWDLGWTLAACVVVFVVLPVASPPRSFVPEGWAGEILAWETSRADFAAASLPSFHVCWALLCARLLATQGGAWLEAGWGWALTVTVACVANGAHAVADVVASLALVPVLTAERSPLRRLLARVEARLTAGRDR